MVKLLPICKEFSMTFWELCIKNKDKGKSVKMPFSHYHRFGIFYDTKGIKMPNLQILKPWGLFTNIWNLRGYIKKKNSFFLEFFIRRAFLFQTQGKEGKLPSSNKFRSPNPNWFGVFSRSITFKSVFIVSVPEVRL